MLALGRAGSGYDLTGHSSAPKCGPGRFGSEFCGSGRVEKIDPRPTLLHSYEPSIRTTRLRFAIPRAAVSNPNPNHNPILVDSCPWGWRISPVGT